MTMVGRDEYASKCDELKCEPLITVLQQIDEAVGKGEAVSKLNLRGISKTKLNEKVTGTKLKAVAETFGNDLERLDLSYNFVDDSSCEPLMGLLQTSPSLKELDLSGNDLCVHGSLLLAKALATEKDKQPVLEALSLQGNPLGDEGGFAISDSIRKNVNLRELNLNDTGIGISSLINVADALTTDNRTIEVIEIGNPKLTTLESEHILYVARMLACNPNIRALNLKKHPLRDASFSVLLESGLARNETLETLCLSCCQITSTSASNIEKFLCQNTSVRHLDLSNNRLTDEVAAGIARGLAQDSAIEVINLQNCRITDAGLLQLAQALPRSKTLKELRLWGNHFGQGSGEAFRMLLSGDGTDGGESKLKCDFTTYVVDGTVHVAQC